MVRARAPYMEWAKSRPRPRIDLAGSNLVACPIAEIPGAAEALDLSGESPDGYPPLLRAIADRYGVAPENVATGVGCSGAAFLAFAALLDAGDEVLFEKPVYDPLVAAAEMLGGRPRFFERRFAEGFGIDAGAVARAATRATRLIVVSNPHNPSGCVLSPGEIDDLARLSEKGGIPVLVDEVYRECVFEERAAPGGTVSPLFLSVNSLTKSYGLASLRCGWVLGSAEAIRRVRRARDVVDVSGPIPAERLAAAAFRAMDRLEVRARAILEPNRRLAREFLSGRGELECAPFSASLAFPRFRSGESATPFARGLFESEGVAVVPGEFFRLPSHFRVSLGGAPEAVRDGLAAVGRALDRIGGSRRA